jgi:tRNA (cmo5U34)-methyltransferase
MPKPPKDRHYREQQPELVDFVFDQAVTRVFPDMIRRSVPGYDTLITLLGLFADKYVTDNSSIYDLGCSTGATSLALAKRTLATGCHLVAVDNSDSMTKQCRKNLATLENLTVEIQKADILNIDINNASLVALNFTLQFIAPAQRASLLTKIYQGLLPQGGFILSEKLSWEQESEQAFHHDFHRRFKIANGYSELEIAQKRSALENVLIPDSLQCHIDRLQQAGFKNIQTWFQCFNFVSIIATK